MSVRLESY